MSTIISISLDDHPKFLMQGWNFLLSLMEVMHWPSSNTDVLVHYPDGIDRTRLRIFETLGARLVPFTPFGPGKAAYCNKLRQLDCPHIQDADYVLLFDADIALLASPLSLCVREAVRAKVVDRANPPEPVWRCLLEEAGLHGDVPLTSPDFSPKEKTSQTNCNGGLYVLPKAAVAVLRKAWLRWAHFCLDRGALLGRWAHHADQLGFNLAMIEMGLPFKPLDLADNFPTHFPAGDYGLVTERPLRAIHYHDHLDDHGLPLKVGVNWIDRQIDKVRQRLSARRCLFFDNRIFWDFRYAWAPKLGSGIGSRGETLAYKRSNLAPFLTIFAERPILDVGCGDIETTCTAPCRDYLGIDISEEALAIAEKKRPDWRFATARTLAHIPPGSMALVLCLDVTIHIQNTRDYHALVDAVVKASGEALIISGYDEPPHSSGIIFFHEPLTQTLENHPEIARVVRIGTYRGLNLLLGIKHPSAGRGKRLVNKNDIGLEALAWGVGHCPTPNLLLELVQMSRQTLCFFPNTIVRTLEYPWIAERLRNYKGRRILDVGAGVNVLPLWLAAQGAHVVTVDNHQVVHRPGDSDSWNEWGFLDYAAFDSRISSRHQDVLALDDADSFDAIYSVSVVEHISAAHRREVIAALQRLLRCDGRLLLTLDLVPDSDALWPLSEGRTVDPEEPHGDLTAVFDELHTAGFTIRESKVVRGIPGSRTDLALIDSVCRGRG